MHLSQTSTTILLLALSFLIVCASASAQTDKAQPKKGKTVDPPLSENPPEAFTTLPKFGSIEWEVTRLPWVGEGPDEGISGMGMVVHEEKIYLSGGFIPGGDGSSDQASHRTSKRTWRYDPKEGDWERLADAPIRREYVRAIAADRAIYLLGGGCQYKGSAPPYRAHHECAVLDLFQDPPAWEVQGGLSVARTHMAVGRAGDYLVVAGGNEYEFAEKGYSHATIRGTTDVLDLTQPSEGWQERTPIPGPGRGWTASVGTDGFLYIFGGLTWPESNTPTGTRETLRYDPTVDRWDTLTPPPLAMSGWEGALYADRYAILVAGVDRGATPLAWSDLVWVYDTEQDQWLRIDDPLPPGAVFNDPGVAIIDNTIYVAGAEGPYGSHYNYFLVGAIRPK